MMPVMQKTDDRAMVFDEINLLLSEKRTALSILRTGIAIFSIPLSWFGAHCHFAALQTRKNQFLRILVDS